MRYQTLEIYMLKNNESKHVSSFLEEKNQYKMKQIHVSQYLLCINYCVLIYPWLPLAKLLLRSLFYTLKVHKNYFCFYTLCQDHNI